MYAILLEIPKRTITIKSLSDTNPDLKITSVELVEAKKLNWLQEENGLTIKPVKDYLLGYAPVFKIKFINKRR